MIFRGARVALLALGLVIPACTDSGATHRSATAPADDRAAPRSPDGLLRRPDLQRVVDAGLRRDADSLIAYLTSGDPVIRARAAYELASVQAADAAPALAALLEDPDARVREDAAFALGQLGDLETCGSLLDALAREQSRHARFLLLEAIGKCGDQSILDRLIALRVTTGDQEGLAVALGRLGRRGIGSAAGGALLMDLIATKDGDVAELAALALAAPRSRRTWRVDQARITRALDQLPRKSVAAGPLLTLLGKECDGSVVTDILAWLDSAASWRTRVNAARALSACADRSEVRAALVRALDDSSVHVATTVAQLLAEAGHPGASELEAWKTWVRGHGERWQVSALLLPGIVAAGDSAFALSWAEQPGQPGIPRWAGYSAIATIHDPRAGELLLSGLAGPDRRSSYVAAGALARRLAGTTASQIEVDRTIAALSPRLVVWGPRAPGSDVRGILALLDALRSRGGPAATALLREAAEHPHPGIRESARRLLGDPPAAPAAASTPAIDWTYLARLGEHPRLRMETNHGAIVLELDTEAAPLAVYTIARAVEDRRYDRLPFHRVEADFIIQSGDFDDDAGFGGTAEGIVSEFSRIPFRRGTIGVASAGKDTEGSQYFITHGASVSLDGRYTAFGRVVEGIAVVDHIALEDTALSLRIE